MTSALPLLTTDRAPREPHYRDSLAASSLQFHKRSGFMEVEEGALSRFLLSKEDSQPHWYLVLLLVGVFLEFFFSCKHY